MLLILNVSQLDKHNESELTQYVFFLNKGLLLNS